MDKQNAKPEAASADFEKKMEELKKIVDTLENDGDVSLEQSMKLFEDGLSLTQECVSKLNEMQARIIELNGRLDLILKQSPFGADDE